MRGDFQTFGDKKIYNNYNAVAWLSGIRWRGGKCKFALHHTITFTAGLLKQVKIDCKVKQSMQF